MTPRRGVLGPAGLLTALNFAALYAIFGFFQPFWPLWLVDWGLTIDEAGQMLAFAALGRVAGGFLLPLIADALAARRRMVALFAILGALVFVLHDWIETRHILLLATVFLMSVAAGIAPVIETMGAAAARARAFSFAVTRGIGSAAFLVASLGGGVLVAWLGIDSVRWAMVIGLLATAGLALWHPGGRLATTAPRPGLRETARFCFGARPLIFALTIAALHASHGIWASFGSLHWDALGISEVTIGRLWAFAVLAEVALLVTVGPRLVAWLGPVNAILVACGVSVLRWTIMCFDPLGLPLYLVQASHAITFGLAHLAMIRFATETLPERFASVSLGMAISLFGGVMTFALVYVGAQIYPVHTGLVYGLGAIAALFSVGFAVLLLLSDQKARAALP